jgi:hypothetical protein
MTMQVESSSLTIKTHIAVLLVAFQMSTPNGEEYSLDVIEYIARRMRDHDDLHVAAVGAFVRITMAGLKAGRLTFQETHARLYAAAVNAPLGCTILAESLNVGPPRR